jgi:hypothetical protein
MLDLPGRRAEDVQLLEVPCYGACVPGWCSFRSAMRGYSAPREHLRQRAPNHERKKLDSSQCHLHAPAMFVVTEAEAAAIRAVYEQRGELSAEVELRRLFPGVTDNVQARECARTIASWQPLRPVKRMPRPPGLRRVR